jgi:signal transduction histidine kinase
VLTQRLSLKLLAPTVLVSLLLVGTCICGAFFLNQLHINVSKVLTENVNSTLAARNLETTTADLIALLRGEHRELEALAEKVRKGNAAVWRGWEAADKLANLDQEQVLVNQIRTGLDAYTTDWERRASLPAVSGGSGMGVSWSAALAAYDSHLAERLQKQVLALCIDLRNFNTEQVAASDRENLTTVTRLTWVLLAVGLGAPLSGLVLGYAVARSLYQSMCQLSVRIRDAAGRLKSEIHPVTLEDPSDLPDLHRQMQGVLEEIERVVERLQQREHEVLRAEQLAAVGQVAAGVAHELRNPLTSVKMLVQTGLEGPVAVGLPAEDLQIIEHEIRRMEGCIQTFLDFARPPRSERRRSDLLAVVRRALALVEGRARRQKVALASDLPPGPLPLFLDPEQIQQVLVNLLLNALDALPHGGEITVEVRGPSADRSGVTVAVRDTGLGIAAHLRDCLFEPFVSGKETGLGLGLSICRRLIEAHDGTIRGENVASGGAVFAFTLPAESGREEERNRQEASVVGRE